MSNLSSEEAMILRWLAAEESSALGECDGASLRSLVQRGFATITAERRGGGFDRVSVTDVGHEWLRSNKP